MQVGAGGAGSPAARWLRQHPTEALVVADLTRRVGIGPSTVHHSAAHFSRDYRRLYGVPPGRDARRLRQVSMAR